MDPSKTKALKVLVLFFAPWFSKYVKAKFVPDSADAYFRRIAKEVEEMRRGDAASERSDVLQQMLDLEKSGKISKIEGLAHTFSFLIESYETSSLTLSFLSYFLAKHRNVQNRARNEVETVLAKHEGQLTYEAINEMSYLEQVINETMRFYPAAGNLAKICSEAYRLEGSDGLVFDVEPGMAIQIPVRGLHMDPEIWENPEVFDPERFTKSNVESRHKFTYLPFGEGPRACPGQRLGMIQVKAAMATVLKNYHLELSPKMQEPIRINPEYFLVTAVGGFWIKLRPLIRK